MLFEPMFSTKFGPSLVQMFDAHDLLPLTLMLVGQLCLPSPNSTVRVRRQSSSGFMQLNYTLLKDVSRREIIK